MASRIGLGRRERLAQRPDRVCLYACDKGHKLLGLSDDDVAKLPPSEFERSPGHFEEWVRAIRGGPAATSNFPDYSGPLTETILLGNLAVWVANEPGVAGKKIEWDAERLVAKNDVDVAGLIRPTYREGYEL